MVHTSSAATLGEVTGTVGSEDSPHRGWYLSDYERSKHDGEEAVLAAGRATASRSVCVNPSSVQGPGRAGGTGRILLALVDGRLKVFLATNISLVDIDDCVEGHVLAAQRGAAGERYLLNGVDADHARGAGADRAGRRGRAAPAHAAPVGGARRRRGRRGRRQVARRRPPLCRQMVRTLLHGHVYDGSRAARELGLRYTAPEDTLGRTVRWAVDEGLVTNVAAPATPS